MFDDSGDFVNPQRMSHRAPTRRRRLYGRVGPASKKLSTDPGDNSVHNTEEPGEIVGTSPPRLWTTSRSRYRLCCYQRRKAVITAHRLWMEEIRRRIMPRPHTKPLNGQGISASSYPESTTGDRDIGIGRSTGSMPPGGCGHATTVMIVQPSPDAGFLGGSGRATRTMIAAFAPVTSRSPDQRAVPRPPLRSAAFR